MYFINDINVLFTSSIFPDILALCVRLVLRALLKQNEAREFFLWGKDWVSSSERYRGWGREWKMNAASWLVCLLSDLRPFCLFLCSFFSLGWLAAVCPDLLVQFRNLKFWCWLKECWTPGVSSPGGRSLGCPAPPPRPEWLWEVTWGLCYVSLLSVKQAGVRLSSSLKRTWVISIENCTLTHRLYRPPRWTRRGWNTHESRSRPWASHRERHKRLFTTWLSQTLSASYRYGLQWFQKEGDFLWKLWVLSPPACYLYAWCP